MVGTWCDEDALFIMRIKVIMTLLMEMTMVITNDENGADDDVNAYPHNTGKDQSFYFQGFWMSPILLCYCQDWSI